MTIEKTVERKQPTAVGDRLRGRRERFALTQEWVANAIGIPRELLSYWETGARTPSPEHLKHLARIYRTTPNRLLEQNVEDATDPLAYFRDDVESEVLREELRIWSAFLDRWAAFLREDLGRTLPGPSMPPAALAEPRMVVDRRRASALAEKVREHWNLGNFAVPELYEFLDRKGVLVLRRDLTELGVGERAVLGAFFNHAELGFCGVANVRATPARQMLTLSHAISHAFFHHSEVGILCFLTAERREERFGEAFGEEFLVPGKELRRQAAGLLQTSGREVLEPVHGVVLANLFSVSFPTIAMRLVSEGLLSEDGYEAWQKVDGRDLAARLGMEPPGFLEYRGHGGPLGAYPSSVLMTVAWAVSDGVVCVERASEVLDVDRDLIENVLLAPAPEVRDREWAEHSELNLVR